MDLGAYLRARRLYESPAVIRAYGALRAAASKLGFQVVLKTFYSPIPDLAALPADTFDRATELPGLDWDLDAQLGRLGETVVPFTPDRYDPGNPSYAPLDANVLYGVVRSAKPKRIVELGSGHTTLVIAQAARENAAEGQPCRVDAYDPFPGVATPDLPGLDGLHPVAAQDIPLGVFEELGDGDLLFVDTTHVVKLGSDVNHIVLQILPRLKPGVIVHVHDIFIPYEYPRQWPERFGLYWTEQYLLHAFLVMNPSYEVLFSVSALLREREEGLRALWPHAMAGGGTAFWMRRTRTDGYLPQA
jgi:hypothetical protein